MMTLYLLREGFLYISIMKHYRKKASVFNLIQYLTALTKSTARQLG